MRGVSGGRVRTRSSKSLHSSSDSHSQLAQVTSRRRTVVCVEVCPVDCIHPTKEEPGFDDVHQLFIDPAECIDCDACVEACPVDAIFAEDQLPDEWKHLEGLSQ